MGLQGFERRLERTVEGMFARVFRSGISPVEIGRRLTRMLDDERTVSVNGRTVVPNDATVELSAVDHERFAAVTDAMTRALADEARSHARAKGYAFMGPVAVRLLAVERMRSGRFEVTGRFKEGPGGTGAGSLLLADGERVPLGDHVIGIGRLADCEIVLEDPNASRRHAEIRPDGDGYVVTDLGSTNGTLVNGQPIDRRRLNDGDVVTIGAHNLRFEAS
jgi:FhaA, N-terminal domain/FHA domain